MYTLLTIWAKDSSEWGGRLEPFDHEPYHSYFTGVSRIVCDLPAGKVRGQHRRRLASRGQRAASGGAAPPGCCLAQPNRAALVWRPPVCGAAELAAAWRAAGRGAATRARLLQFS
jgi:hypothetical protein